MKVYSTVQLLLCLLTTVAEIDGARNPRKCRAVKGKFYSEPWTGRCKRCEICPPGQEWDTGATIRRSKERGDLECYPCTACKDGFYKEHDTLKSCSPCLLECGVLRRYLEVACGGVRRGHCGSCLPGYEDVLGNTDMSCTARPKTDAPKRREPLPIANPTPRVPTTTSPPRISHSSSHLSSDAKDLILIAVSSIVVILVGISIVVFIKWCLKRRTKSRSNGNNRCDRRDITARDVNSSTRLFSSSSSVQDPRDLETDGPASGVRGELPVVVTSPEYTGNGSARPRSMAYPARVLTKDDNILSVIAEHIYDVAPLFTLLRIPNQIQFEQKHLFERNINSYRSYMLNILIYWVTHEPQNATLDVLCEALNRAGLHEALDEIDKDLGISEGCVS